MSITEDQGYCDTCKHRSIRDDSLNRGIPGEQWKKPCRDCDIERNYLWEAVKRLPNSKSYPYEPLQCNGKNNIKGES